jgi:hypothetical protein
LLRFRRWANVQHVSLNFNDRARARAVPRDYLLRYQALWWPVSANDYHGERVLRSLLCSLHGNL